ncbi:hypothetical protein TCAL_07121 [Tigriopus californicus]|uniref:Uncharacterized protein n=1 Tax=Tigriopus californicus TaxID=6832 RepID=A0A553PCY0_TIGCA|nr:uncharacterized protein LOC131877193 [Tigriopus californicus]TRY75542.1 hypothetical protein TCAL_07121 [Tigriopus californicus]|eukprot:TCALIF_07121-PA protein Name:"Protein of unknown function" AED:0.00 eAED:0.00 QI:21/1/1/1/1/1/3/43/177
MEEQAHKNTGKSVRYALLQQCQEKSKQKWRKLQDQRRSDFSSVLPEAIRKDKNFVSQLHKQLMADIDQAIGEAFQDRFDEWNLSSKLEKLDQIEEDCKELAIQNAWRPSGTPKDDLAAHCTQRYLDEHDKLDNDVFKPLKHDVTDLLAEVQVMCQKVEENKSEIQTILDHPLAQAAK